MKKLSILFLLIFFIQNVFAQKNIRSLKIILVQLGEKEIGFNESKFPDISFFYTPKLNLHYSITTNKLMIKGKPKILEEWSEKQNLQFHAILFDINGNGAWEGNLEMNNNILNSNGYNNTSLTQALIKYAKNKNTVTKTTREFKIYSSNSVYRGKYYQCPFIERKMIPFYIYDNNYNASLISEIIEYKKPVLIVFFYMNNTNNMQLLKYLEQLINSDVYKNQAKKNN